MTSDEVVVRRLRKRYRTQDLAFRFFDAVLGKIVGSDGKRPLAETGRPKRILVANAGHIGDVIISTAVLSVLRNALPDVELGFLTGSYSRPAIENHPFISRVHYLDHWHASRDQLPLLRKVGRYKADRTRVIEELRACRYGVAIDLRAWFPNFIPVLAAARIPIRIGYGRLGFGPLLTHRLRHSYDRRHELDHQLDLLRCLSISSDTLSRARPSLPATSETGLEEANSLLGSVTRFRVLHPGASTPIRDWPLAHWKALAQDLLKEGITPVLTGRGARDSHLVNDIVQAVPGCINACNRLSWDGLAELMRKAELVYSVETSAGHLAAALGRPTVAIYGGMADPCRWKPTGAVVATNVLPCHPCFNKKGCATRGCLTGLSLEHVQSAAREALRSHEASAVDFP
jgi:ADP-heptose:LPS heptosyltransferase